MRRPRKEKEANQHISQLPQIKTKKGSSSWLSTLVLGGLRKAANYPSKTKKPKKKKIKRKTKKKNQKINKKNRQRHSADINATDHELLNGGLCAPQRMKAGEVPEVPVVGDGGGLRDRVRR